VVPETVTVGDRFRSVLRVDGDYEAIEFFPVPVGDTIQPVDTMQVSGGESPTAVYSLVSWRTGTDLDVRLPIRILREDGEFVTYLVPLRLPVVLSVLPEDTSARVPRPHRGVLEESAVVRARLSWWWLLLAIPLLALLAAWWLQRSRAVAAELESPREQALRKLADLEATHLVRPEEYARLYPAATRVLRDYLAAVEPGWGADLTSTELLAVLARDETAPAERAELARVLTHADAVKFARHAPTPAELDAFWSGVRTLVLRLPRQEQEAEVAA
jgi:hypothetical protein